MATTKYMITWKGAGQQGRIPKVFDDYDSAVEHGSRWAVDRNSAVFDEAFPGHAGRFTFEVETIHAPLALAAVGTPGQRIYLAYAGCSLLYQTRRLIVAENHEAAAELASKFEASAFAPVDDPLISFENALASGMPLEICQVDEFRIDDNGNRVPTAQYFLSPEGDWEQH